MSGRSAYVRAKKASLADDASRNLPHDYSTSEGFVYGFPGALPARPPMQIALSTPQIRRRQSVSSAGSNYAYSMSPTGKPRPIIIASAIEKSDFRTHLDGMSKTVRGRLGKLIRGGDEGTNNQLARRSSADDGSECSSGFIPSISALPPIGPSTPPADATIPYPKLASPAPHITKPKQRQQSISATIRRFEGGGRQPQLGWKSLSSNPELWDENGDTLVYMYMRGSRTKPPPSFRINSTVLYELRSKAFMNQLHDASVPQGWPRFCPSDMPSPDATSSPDDAIPSLELPQRTSGHTLVSTESEDIYSPRSLPPYHRPTKSCLPGIHHEIYIAWPGTETGLHSTTWHITTRNFFAVLYNANSLVGTSIYEALTRLHERVVTYPDYLDRSVDLVNFITDYILRHEFDDVRNNPAFAASLLAFSELPQIQWREGYTEAFVHCVGMLNMGLQNTPEFRLISPRTKMFMQNANLELEERLHRSQTWLFTFDFTEMWPTTSAPPSASHAAFDRFRKWLCKYYEKAFLHWPPTAHDQTWLTHDLVVRLRNDFNALYDYLVDRTVVFDEPEQPGRRWAITSTSGQIFRADTSDLRFTDILLGFDDRNGFPHIPHPYPVTPPSAPVQKSKTSFTLKRPATHSEIQAQSRRKALSYSEASNVYILRDQYNHTDLVTNFIHFEQSDMLEHVDPFEARRGRWLLIYGVLQVLGTVSVDSPNLRYSEGVQYHVSPQMKGIVPWAAAGSPPEDEACHTKSHPWVVHNTWAATTPKITIRPGAHKPILWGPYGDGRARAVSAEKLPAPPEPVREMNVGIKRAEEWVATTANHQQEAISIHTVSERKNSRGSGDVPSGSSGEGSIDSAALAARRRRALIHGFTDFQVPSDW